MLNSAGRSVDSAPGAGLMLLNAYNPKVGEYADIILESSRIMTMQCSQVEALELEAYFDVSSGGRMLAAPTTQVIATSIAVSATTSAHTAVSATTQLIRRPSHHRKADDRITAGW